MSPPQNHKRKEIKPSRPPEPREAPHGANLATAENLAQAAESSALWDWLLAAALVVTLFMVYRPAWQGDFIFDDDTHLLDNPVLKPGGLAKVWLPGSYLNYWPITYTAYWLEHRLWGLNPLGFHLVNIALHAISALLVWRILLRLRVPGAMLASAIFALHPVNVESVAWIAQLKGALSLALALVSVLLFLAHEKQGGWSLLVASLAAFVLSTLAKGIVITLPVVLLACAWWQRRRIGRCDVLRVVPFVVVGLIMTGMEVWSQGLVGANSDVHSGGFLNRAATAGCAVWFYFWKLIWPLNLCFVYPHGPIDDQGPLRYLPGALLAAVLAFAWSRRVTYGRPILVLIVCYVGLLLPVLGFANIYFMRFSPVTDHWQYAAMIVPCAVFAGTAVTLIRRCGCPRWIGSVICLGLLAPLAALTWRQSHMYADAETLYQTTIDRNPDCWMAHNNLGLVLAGHGQFDEAIVHYQKAIEIKPDYAEPHYNLGNVLFTRGQLDEAIAHFKKVLELEPEHAQAHNNLGLALAGQERVDEAISQYRLALQIKPDYLMARFNLGLALTASGQLDDAIGQFLKVLEIQPDHAEAHYNLANVLAGRRRFDDAIAHYRQALKLKPNYAEAHNNLGVLLADRGQFDEAIAHLQKALEIKPDYAQARNNLVDAQAARERNKN
ncbi:MAG TPA: tetratricopeptide repeat protein [Pirellulales bacterium]|jgi:tetratricopeptide (TPR) repeat protein|nr:tetratricopeptide repeat protein [Pirellulales bacterium]